MKLNLGGMRKREGYTIAGLWKGSDIKIDLESENWPWASEEIEDIRASHILEHIKEPYSFLSECYRILKPGARLTIIVPHWHSSFECLEHRWHWGEKAIESITNSNSTIFPHKFDLIETRVKRRRFMKWKKTEIVWVLEKPLEYLRHY